MISISLCMIVKNEEAVLERCLNTAADIADEIIIADTGSTDKTKEIAAKFTDKIYDFQWIDDFSAARNFSFSKATKDFILWLDADDIIEIKDRKQLLKLKKELTKEIDIVVMKYNTHFDQNGNPILSSQRERLINREKGFLWNDPIHEFITIAGNIMYSDIAVTHKKEAEYTDRNIKIYNNLESKGHDFSPRQLYYYGRELKDHGQYHKSAVYFEKFLATGRGWSEDNITACFNLAHCYERINLQEKILPVLLKSFEYDTPRAENCCMIGYYYKNRGDYKKAADWFLIAKNLKKPETFCFILNDYWDFIPVIELCVCHYHLGDIKKAMRYNNMARKYKPDSPGVKSNDEFFEQFNIK